MLKITMEQMVKEGCEIPRWYGIGYTNYLGQVAHCYPVPINIIVCVVRRLWQHLKMGLRKTEFDRVIAHVSEKAYQDGFNDGANYTLRIYTEELQKHA